MSQPLTAILIGAGSRGYEAYSPYALAHPDEIRFVAVAEPHDARRARFAQAHAIPPERQFRTWEDLLAQGQIADTALVCTLDRTHVEPTVAALEAGYDVLLEKPMATTLADCVRLVQTAEHTGQLLQICHVLRYTAFFSTLHDIVTSGRLGDIITVEHRENVVYWHMAHSYVRGNWRDSQVESPMILAKCCHDLDILYWNLGPCKRLNSFGSLIHFRAENAPEGAPQRCTDGCPAADDCAWYAPRFYLHDYTGWPISVISEDTGLDARRRALETGPYGRCVYRCDNDVVDHQTVNMEFESGASVVLVMHGHSHREGRTMRYDGTRATLRGQFYVENPEIQIHDHLSSRMETIHPSTAFEGHGGGDTGIMAAFIRAVRDPAQALTTGRESLESHLMAFAAEQARVDGSIVSMDGFRRQAEVAPGA
jgi:predicted dehydrogenase